jgi:hypothetical protein
MTDNITIKDGAGSNVIMRSTDTGTSQVPMSIPANTAGNAAAFGSGANGATVPRIALATDSPGVYTPGVIGTLSSQVVSVDVPSAASSIATTEDAASADGDKGVKVLFRRQDAPVNSSGTDLDYEMPSMSRGLVHTNPVPKFIDAAGTAITRPANTTPYTAGDAVSNNATAGSVTSGTFTLSWINDDPVSIEELLMDATDTGVGGKAMRVYLYNSDPTASSGVGGGDNVAWSQKKAGFIGSMTGVMLAASDGAHGRFIPEAGSRIMASPVSGAKTIFWLLQTIDAWTPSANSTVFTPRIKGFQGHA